MWRSFVLSALHTVHTVYDLSRPLVQPQASSRKMNGPKLIGVPHSMLDTDLYKVRNRTQCGDLHLTMCSGACTVDNATSCAISLP